MTGLRHWSETGPLSKRSSPAFAEATAWHVDFYSPRRNFSEGGISDVRCSPPPPSTPTTKRPPHRRHRLPTATRAVRPGAPLRIDDIHRLSTSPPAENCSSKKEKNNYVSTSLPGRRALHATLRLDALICKELV